MLKFAATVILSTVLVLTPALRAETVAATAVAAPTPALNVTPEPTAVPTMVLEARPAPSEGATFGHFLGVILLAGAVLIVLALVSHPSISIGNR